MKEFAGKTVLVTGSGRNLGRATVLEFAERGANVVVTARSNRGEAEHVAAEARERGAEAMVVMGDVSEPQLASAWRDEIRSRFGRVDILVSNAAVRAFQSFWETSAEDWQRYLTMNLSAAFFLAKTFAGDMREAGWGRIINVSGIDGWGGASHRPHNVTAKAGLHGLTKALAVELGAHGITVNTLATGVFNTTRDPRDYPANRAELAPTRTMGDSLVGRRGEPEEFAFAVAFLASPRAGYITGSALHINGGMLLI
jgi:NAD(P)-dependent dehydrogenase (short-subunit alcohol dehydrogenase family)